MKRIGHLYEKLISDENLLEAIETVNASHRWIHFPNKPNRKTLWVEKTKDERVKELRQIIERGFEASPVRPKKRYDANARKWRDICEPRLWPDQYIHHALIQILEPVMMRGMDKFCCGSIKGRGAHYGIKAVKKWMKNDVKGTTWCVEMDIRHFYDNLTPETVMTRMKQLIKDRRVLDLIYRVTKDGILIGAYFSQWFANTTLQPLDHLLREKVGVRHYVRYMDNFTVFVCTKKEADAVIAETRKWLRAHDLELKDNWQKFRIRARMPCNGKRRRYPNALGYRFGRGFTLLRKHNLLKLKRQLKAFYILRARGKRIPLRFAQGLLSRMGMLTHCNNVRLYEQIKPKTQKRLKAVVRKYQRKETATWNMFLEQRQDAA